MFKFIDNWKMVAAWALMQIPQLTDFPGLMTAIQEALAHGNRQTFINLFVQLLMAVGAAHRVKKNLSK